MEILLDFGMQIADALQAAHARNVFHGALGPETVMVTEGDQIKVMDFGLARLADTNAAAASVAGDFHALGRLLHAMATGNDPGDAPELPSVAETSPLAPETLDALIDRATGKEGQAPFRDAAEMAEALSRAMTEAAPEYVPPPPAKDADQPASGEPDPRDGPGDWWPRPSSGSRPSSSSSKPAPERGRQAGSTPRTWAGPARPGPHARSAQKLSRPAGSAPGTRVGAARYDLHAVGAPRTRERAGNY